MRAEREDLLAGLFLMLLVSVAGAAESRTAMPPPSGTPAALSTIPVEYAVTFESFAAPDPSSATGAEEKLGLLGVRADFPIVSGFRFGVGAVVSAAGKRGGFLVMGLGVGHDLRVVGPLRLQSELFVGGGGGSLVPVGSGLLLRPSLALVAELGPVTVGGGYSVIAFPAVGTWAHQPFARVSVASDFSALTDAPATRSLRWRPSRWQLRPLVKLLRTGGLANLMGGPLSPWLSLVGVQIDHAAYGALLTSIELLGAFGGNAGGFSMLGLGVGYDVELLPGCHLVPRLYAGAGGGGQIDTGGGIYLEPSLDVSLALSRVVSITGGAGYVHSLGGVLRALSLHGGLSVGLDGIEADEPVRQRAVATGPADRRTGWRFAAGGLRYFSEGTPANKGTYTLRDVDLLALRLDLRLTPLLFVSASSYWPVGGNAGGYAAGLLGLGAQIPVAGPVSVEARLSLGAAAGGGVPAAGGAVLQADGAVAVEVGRGLSLAAGGGYLFYRSGFRTAAAQGMLRYAFELPIGL